MQNYYEKMEKRQERQTDSSKKEHTTKLITPQIAKVEHSYRPGKCKEFCTTTSTTPYTKVIIWKLMNVCQQFSLQVLLVSWQSLVSTTPVRWLML